MGALMAKRDLDDIATRDLAATPKAAIASDNFMQCQRAMMRACLILASAALVIGGATPSAAATLGWAETWARLEVVSRTHVVNIGSTSGESERSVIFRGNASADAGTTSSDADSNIDDAPFVELSARARADAGAPSGDVSAVAESVGALIITNFFEEAVSVTFRVDYRLEVDSALESAALEFASARSTYAVNISGWNYYSTPFRSETVFGLNVTDSLASFTNGGGGRSTVTGGFLFDVTLPAYEGTENGQLRTVSLSTRSDVFALRRLDTTVVAPVPLPAGGALLISALLVLGVLRRRSRVV